MNMTAKGNNAVRPNLFTEVLPSSDFETGKKADYSSEETVVEAEPARLTGAVAYKLKLDRSGCCPGGPKSNAKAIKKLVSN